MKAAVRKTRVVNGTGKRKGRGNRINGLAVIAIAAIFIFLLGIRIKNMEQEDKELAAKVNDLQTTYEQECSRTAELEAQKIYVQTKQYIEEMAKKLGLVYPDEIIFKPAN